MPSTSFRDAPFPRLASRGQSFSLCCAGVKTSDFAGVAKLLRRRNAPGGLLRLRCVRVGEETQRTGAKRPTGRYRRSGGMLWRVDAFVAWVLRKSRSRRLRRRRACLPYRARAGGAGLTRHGCQLLLPIGGYRTEVRATVETRISKGAYPGPTAPRRKGAVTISRRQ
jgi:hypothetical protein